MKMIKSNEFKQLLTYNNFNFFISLEKENTSINRKRETDLTDIHPKICIFIYIAHIQFIILNINLITKHILSNFVTNNENQPRK